MGSYTREQIINHLENIKVSVQRDAGTAIDHYMDYFFKNDTGIGLFAIPRLLFPEIDGLGAYYSGSNINQTAKNSVNFMRDYFGKVNPEYKRKGAFIYIVYRHGLMHTHTPKVMTYRNQNIGWVVSLSAKNSTPTNHLGVNGKTVVIDGLQFYKDFLDAVDFYIEDIKKNDQLVEKFNKAVIEMNKPINKTSLLKKYKNQNYISASDFDFLKDN